MKIVYVITRSDVIGGASVHLLDLALGAQRAGHHVNILVGGEGVFLSRAKKEGICCISLRHMVREINPFKDFLCFLELKKAISVIAPDIVHLHSSKAGILGRLVAKSLSIPVIFTAHGWAFTEGVSRNRRIFYRAIEQLMARFTDKIITVSEYDRQLALKLNVGVEKQICTINNGMPDVNNLPEMPSTDVVRLIMVARFDAQKNHLALINTLACLKHLRWILEFVGDGPSVVEVRKAVQYHSLEERVIFSGSCNDIPTRLASADIFFLISNWEGLPLTILEAMRAGLPVVASNVGGVPESIEHNISGFLVARGDQKMLGEVAARLICSARLRKTMGRAGRKKFEDEFTFEKMLKKTLDVYIKVLNEKS